MKKGQETGLTILISVIVLIIIVTQYFIFFVISPDKTIISPESQSQIGSEIELDLMTFVKLNSDLIIKSTKNNNYDELEKEITKLNLGDCWRIKIKDKTFQSKNFDKTYECQVKFKHTTKTNIPDYNNKKIEIKLSINK